MPDYGMILAAVDVLADVLLSNDLTEWIILDDAGYRWKFSLCTEEETPC